MLKRNISKTEVIDKLRRLADALEQDVTFEIQIDGERIYVPPYAQIEFEYERDSKGNEEIEIELKWNKS